MFTDRVEAGRRLAGRLEHLRHTDLVVLGLPRGGVPVAFQVAEALQAPLDVIVVRKLGVPWQPELGMGAVGEDGVRIVNEEVVRVSGVDEEGLRRVEERERGEVERRAERFREGRTRLPLTGRVALIVDDGIATGSTARAACRVARAHGASRVVVATPVAPPSTVERLAGDADEVVCLETPQPFYAIGQFYGDFSQTSEAEVASLLERAATRTEGRPAPAPGGERRREEEVTVQAGPVCLAGTLIVPAEARGVVLFAHGSGSSRRSPRNRYVAGVLGGVGFGTLLFDLLTEVEERDRANVFDVPLLAGRLAAATLWLRDRPEVGGLAVGYFGASTGAAAALWAAAEPGVDVAAVVSRGGRPDLAGPRLAAVEAPTLLIVGGRDEAVLELNRQAQKRLVCPNRLDVVPGATHLFEEPGALQRVADLAAGWFGDHLVRP